ncbi:two-component system LytT family sensor kinase [Pedobacter africanus]|uniref:Sensor histidine kinase YesM n=1 Tax=Pedobacter africanus TaxID=151894 RepID=A0ACC6KUA3_9SPHI|nr:histidine kinase [Pedobacter africanus]MDR6782811.1 sensor histidine kinase YesM [Pedobacter africanus]
MKTAVKFRYISIALHALIWAMVLLLPYLVSSAAHEYKIGPIPGYFFSLAGLIHLFIFYFNAFFLVPRLLNRRFWWLYIVCSAALILGSFQLKYHMLAWWFPEVLKDLTAYKFVFAPSVAVFIISIVYRKVIDKLRQDREQQKIKTEQLSTELKFLRSQISPHFLFNVLSNLVSLARKKSDQMEPSLIMLSELMRYMLYETQGKKVRLDKEIAYLNNYIALQRMRFGTDVEIRYHTAVNTISEAQLIEPMLIIPFVENAFKHGIGYQTNPVISINLSVTNNELFFEAINQFDEQSNSSKDGHSGIGLANVKSRLDLLYKNKYNLKIQQTGNQFHITLTLQLI